MKVHFTDQYIMNPQHKVTINLIGLGGTGSQVLTGLARMNETLIALNHPGVHVYAWDDDIVSDANIGRQLFSIADIGQNKAVCLVTRINRYFGYEWEANPVKYEGFHAKNITISCIDSAVGRVELHKVLHAPGIITEPMDVPYYWMDFGNLQKTGQVVLGTLNSIKQPKSQYEVKRQLPTVVKLFPEIKTIVEDNQGPSCSLAEAISKQDLYINSTLANLGCNLLWKLFREGMIKYHGLYLNLDTMLTNPIKIK